MKPIKLKINTKTESYPIIIGTKLLTKFSKLISHNLTNFEKCLLVIDKNIPQKKITQIKNVLRIIKLDVSFLNINRCTIFTL